MWAGTREKRRYLPIYICLESNNSLIVDLKILSREWINESTTEIIKSCPSNSFTTIFELLQVTFRDKQKLKATYIYLMTIKPEIIQLYRQVVFTNYSTNKI